MPNPALGWDLSKIYFDLVESENDHSTNTYQPKKVLLKNFKDSYFIELATNERNELTYQFWGKEKLSWVPLDQPNQLNIEESVQNEFYKEVIKQLSLGKNTPKGAIKNLLNLKDDKRREAYNFQRKFEKLKDIIDDKDFQIKELTEGWETAKQGQIVLSIFSMVVLVMLASLGVISGLFHIEIAPFTSKAPTLPVEE